MKKIVLFSFLILSFIKCFSQIQNNPDKNFVEYISKEESRRYVARKQNLQSRAGNNYDLKYHRFELEIDPDTLYIKGAVTSYFRTTDNIVGTISFDLSEKLQIDSIIYHRKKTTFTFSNNLIDINVPPLSSATFDSVTVYYQGSPSSSGFGSFVKSNHPDGNIIWTLSEPYGAMDWWPCKQGLTDKIDSIDIFVQTPKLNRVASNGLLIGEIEKEGKKTFHWKHRYPIATYLIGIAVTNYAVYSNFVPFKSDTLQVLNYVYPSSLANAQALTKDIIPTMQVYDSLFIPYPFMKEKYGHAQFGWGGGMEHQTMTFITSFGHDITAHELAHQWFGDKITCGSWSDIWLNEGFATYLTGLSYEHMADKTNWRNWKQLLINNIISRPDGSVFVNDTSTVGRIFDGRLSYNKGASLLHMARGIIGDSAFFQGLRNYLNDPMLAYNFARTSHLKYHLEKSSGKDLTKFFNNWYYGEGYPTYEVNWTQDGKNNVSLTLMQTTSHNSISFFEMPVPLLFKTTGHDTIIKVQHSFSGEFFSVNPGFKIDSVIVDPDNWIVKGTPAIALGLSQSSLPQISISPNPCNDIVNIASPYIFSILKTYDILGILQFEEHKSQKDLKLDFSRYKPGVYILEFSAEDFVVKYKVIKN